MAEFLAGQGVDKAAFIKAYNSFGVKSQMEKAKLAMAYQISGVPTLIVNGKYRFDIGSSGGPEQATQVADFLIARSAPRSKRRPAEKMLRRWSNDRTAGLRTRRSTRIATPAACPRTAGSGCSASTSRSASAPATTATT